MKNLVHIYRDMNKLEKFLNTTEIQTYDRKSKSVLIQIFSSKNEQELLTKICKSIRNHMPLAHIVGTTTIGEIASGYMQLRKIVISFSFFYDTNISTFAYSCENEEAAYGEKLMQEILSISEKIAGILVFATPLTLGIDKVFQGMSGKEFSFPVFGGGAGSYDTSRTSKIFCDNEYMEKGMIAVVFIGKELQISVRFNLGWQPMGKEMVITKADGLVAKTIDNVDAFELYRKYLNIKNDENFFQNVLEFPLLVDRDGHTVARVPGFAHEDNSIEFISEIVEGEHFRIGYGDPDFIVENARKILEEMKIFEPETIFIYACICRRFLMQNDVNLETHPFDEIATTTGFFTYGEFYNFGNQIKTLNSTIVIVGMKEGENDLQMKTDHLVEKMNYHKNAKYLRKERDLYSNKHNHIISRLLSFIGQLTLELENVNIELLRVSEIDKLTGLYNRMKIDLILEKEVKVNEKVQGIFSILLLDIDFFKKVNDTYGHLIGDETLITFSNILKNSVSKNDFTGRWGGEEFLIVLPNATSKEAQMVAEKVCLQVNNSEFKNAGHITCSIGISSYRPGDSGDMLIQRADLALYQVKNSGRNRWKKEDDEQNA